MIVSGSSSTIVWTAILPATVTVLPLYQPCGGTAGIQGLCGNCGAVMGTSGVCCALIAIRLLEAEDESGSSGPPG